MDPLRVTVWTGRAAWALLPLAAGPALGDALHDWDTTVRTTASTGLWVLWLATLIATLVPHPVALTAWRVLTPAAGAAVALAALGGHASVLGAIDCVIALGAAFAPATGSVCVNGPAYPNERRFPLRPPAIALVGPAALAWVVVVGGPTGAVLLLAAGRWIAGAIVAIVGGLAATIAGRALHGLARRWLVVVPAGLVIHDPLSLADPVLFQRATIAGLGPAPAAAADRLDLTSGALGLALELRLTEPTGLLVIERPGRRPTAATVTATRIAIAPTRAAAVLAEVADRGYRVS